MSKTYKDIADMAYMMATGVFGASKYRRDNNGYNYGYQYNVGLYEDGAWHSDCLGFVHICVNGFYGDRNILGGGATMDDFVLMSDEATTLNKYCSNRGTFPASLKPASLVQNSGHVGLYIGEHTVNGLVYNVAECTLALAKGWLLTYVDTNTGKRYAYKGGVQLATGWANWGEFDMIDYSEQKTQLYSDVTEDMNTYKAIKWATDQGIVKGFSDGTFRPDDACTRQQICVMLWRMAGKPEI